MTILKAMDIKELRQMIRSSLRTQIKEAVAAAHSAPKNFSEFRKQLIAALHAAGYPADFVELVETDGGEAFGVAYEAYENISSELRGVKPAQLNDEYKSVAAGYVQDLVLDIVGIYRQGPGRKKKLSDAMVTSAVENMLPITKASGSKMANREFTDMIAIVEDLLSDAGVGAVATDTTTGTVSFDGAISPKLLPKALKASGLVPVPGEASTYVDDITGLKVTLGSGVAKIH